jgi:ABC-type uncharacterized transport system permease subunit
LYCELEEAIVSTHRLWIVLAVALCGIFAALALFGATVRVILCVGFPILVASVLVPVVLLEEPLSIISNQLNEITRELKKR